MKIGMGWTRARWPVLLLLMLGTGVGCRVSAPPAANWSSMQFLVGNWGCEAHYLTPQGELTVPMVTRVTRAMGGSWLEIHREAPGWKADSGRYVENSYVGWDQRRGRWVETLANDSGVQGYLTTDGWHGGVVQWDEHPFTDISLPLRGRAIWRRIGDEEWIVQRRVGAETATAGTVTSERCLKQQSLNL